jgi:hypothetical protein
MVGPVEGIARAMQNLEEYGLAHGYYPEPSKSIFVPSSPEAKDDCQQQLAEFKLEF